MKDDINGVWFYPSTGKSGNKRGAAAERRVLRLLQLYVEDTAWVQSARMCTPDEDRQGIDVVVMTDVGPLHIQVKSSKRSADAFAKKNMDPNIIVLIAGHKYTDWHIDAELRASLSGARANILANRNTNGTL